MRLWPFALLVQITLLITNWDKLIFEMPFANRSVFPANLRCVLLDAKRERIAIVAVSIPSVLNETAIIVVVFCLKLANGNKASLVLTSQAYSTSTLRADIAACLTDVNCAAKRQKAQFSERYCTPRLVHSMGCHEDVQLSQCLP